MIVAMRRVRADAQLAVGRLTAAARRALGAAANDDERAAGDLLAALGVSRPG